MSNPIVSTMGISPVVTDILKAKREKLLLARTAPVENSDEKPEVMPMPVRSYFEESAEKKRKRMTISKSECNSSPAIKKSAQWRSVDSPKEMDRTTTFALPTRASRRLCEKDKKKKEVKFGGVHVYYFGRNQSYCTVPTSEGASLGMENKHHSSKNYSFYEFSRATTRQHEQKWSVLREYLQQQTKPRRSPRKNVVLKPSLSHTVENEISKAVKEVLDSVLNKVCQTEKPRELEDAEMSDADFNDIIEAESDSDDEDEVLPLPEAEILQPLDKIFRHAILEQSNVELDLTDDTDCQEIRQSRTKCGCSCEDGFCIPETCECAMNGIKCQVDLESFPCVCKQDRCSNPEGRVEFNPLRVRSHYSDTLKKLNDAEKTNFEYKSFLPRHIKFADSDDEDSGTSYSYLDTPPPLVYQRETTVQLTTDVTVAASTTTTANTSTSSITISQCVNNNNKEDNIFSQSDVTTSLMETPPHQYSQMNQEQNVIPKRKYPVTPTYPIYKRENAIYDFESPPEALFPPSPSLMGPTPLRRSPRSSPMKRPHPPPSLTSIVVVGNVPSPSPKRARKIPSARSIIVNFSQTIDEENFPFEALEQPESSKYEGNGS